MNIKSLLLGSAAALVAVSGARAADAVVIAEPEPMEYVRICDTYGVGFYYIPGTETCLKVSGYIRYDIGVGANGLESIDKEDAFEAYDDDELDDFDFEDQDETYFKRARFQLRVDSRTETELGTLRTYAAVNFQYDTVQGLIADEDLFPNDDNDDQGFFTTTSDRFAVEHAYLELGGFRVGKTDSLFSTFTGYASGVANDGIVPYGPFGTHQIAYTFNGGNGFNAAVALEEGNGVLYTLDSYVPHVVGGLGWTGGWGGVSMVAGYDSVWEDVSVKGRVDFNIGDAWSFFVMAGWDSGEFDNGNGGESFYAPWGGDYAVWFGGAWKFTESTTLNMEIGYDEDENFGAVLGLDYYLVDNFLIKPEIVYTDNFSDDEDDDDGEWGAFLRLQANFGG